MKPGRITGVSVPFSASARQIAAPMPLRRPAPVTTTTRPRNGSATLAQDPGILRYATARDVDQATTGRGNAGHGAGDHLDGPRVRYETVYPVIGVRIAQGYLAVLDGAQDVGREVYGVLGDVLDGVLLNHVPKLLDRFSGFLRGDQDVLAPPATAALYHQLVEVLHHVAAILLDGQGEGLEVGDHRLLPEVPTDHLRDKRVDAFVVYDLRVGGEDGMDSAFEVGLDEPGVVVVDSAILYALVDHVYPPPRLLVYQIASTVNLDLVPLGEDGARLFGEEVVVEIVLVFGAGREDGERRIGEWRGRPQHLAEPTEQVSQRTHPERRVCLREHVGGQRPQAAHGHRPYRHPRVVLDDAVPPAPVSFTLKRDKVYTHLARGHLPESVGDRSVVEGARLQDLPGYHLLLAGFEAPQELVDCEQPLGQAALQDLPVGGGEKAWEPVGRVPLVSSKDAEAVLLDQAPLAGPPHSSLPLLDAHSLQLVEHRPVQLPWQPVAREDLVRPRLFELHLHGRHVTS